MTITNHWFIESNEYDDMLMSVNINTPFEQEGDSHKQLELFTTEEPQLEDVSY
jgi:hypothetical protein